MAHIQPKQDLPLILMNPLGHDIEHGISAQLNSTILIDPFHKTLLAGKLGRCKFFTE